MRPARQRGAAAAVVIVIIVILMVIALAATLVRRLGDVSGEVAVAAARLATAQAALEAYAASATRLPCPADPTATVATALYKRGLRNQMIQDVRPLSANQPTLVGEAFTLRYMPAREDLNKLEVFRDPEHPQRKAVEICPAGAVLVMDSRKDPRAASAGGILVTRLMKRGVAGVVTDGGFRDSAEIASLGFPAYHNRPSAPTNLTLHQAIEINVPIGCGDAPVFPGDVVLGDQDGVIIIPAHLADEIANEAHEMTAFEDFVTEEVRGGRSIRGLYPATEEKTLTDFAAWRKKNNR